MLARYEKLILNHPWLVLTLSAVITVFFAFMMTELEFSSSTEKFFVSNAPQQIEFENAKKYFGNDQVIVIAMMVPEGGTVYSVESLRKLQEVTEAVARVKGVENAVSLVNVPAIRAPRDPMTGAYEKRIEIKPLVPEIPADNNYDGPAWRAIFDDVQRIPLYEYNLVSKARRDGNGRIIPSGVKAAAVLTFVKDFRGETWRYRGLVKALEDTLAGMGGPQTFNMAGIPYTRVQTERRMMDDLQRLIPLSILVLAVMLAISYRNVRGVVLPLITVICIMIVTMGFTEWIHIPITLVTLILPPLMLALGSSYSIHMMSEYLAEAESDLSGREIVKLSLRKVTLPIIVCGFTTMIGFASLTLNKIPAIQDLGYAAVVGIFISLVVALLVIPASLMIMNRPPIAKSTETGPGRVDAFLGRLSKIVIHHRRAVFVTAAALVVLSLAGISRIEINTDFLAFFSPRDPVRVAATLQAEYLAGAAPFNIVLKADREDAFKHPEMLRRIEALQQWVEDPNNVAGIDTTVSIADFLMLFNQAFHQNDPAFRDIPTSPGELSPIIEFFPTKDFAQYITTDYSIANVLIRSRLVGSSETNRAIAIIENQAQELFKPPERVPRVDESPKTQVPAPMAPPDGDNEEEIGWLDAGGTPEASDGDSENQVLWPDDSTPAASDTVSPDPGRPGPNQCLPTEDGGYSWPHITSYVTGTIHLLNKSADAVSKGQVKGLGTTLIAIFIVMSLLFLSPRIGLLSMVPNLVPIFILFGLMGATGISLNFSTSLIAAIAVGIGIDDTIHYINHFNQEVQKTRDQNEAMVSTLVHLGKPMIYTSVALFFGFGIFIFSDFVPIRQFGFLTAITILIAMFSNLIILPSLLVSVRIVTLWDLLDLAIGDTPAHYIKIFHGLTNHQARIAVLMGYLKEYNEGELIFREQEMGSEMFVVIKGLVEIIKGEGKSEVLLATTAPGDAFGEMALLRHTTRTASARAKGPVKLFVIDEQTFSRLQKRYPKISSNILYQIGQSLSDRLQAANLRVYECAVDFDDLDNHPPS